MSLITQLTARQILDSRGNPTLEVDLYTQNGVMSRASVPSGASTGIHEAVELRDGDETVYMGKGVTKAIQNINGTLNQELNGASVLNQSLIDRAMIGMDGTENKALFGANAILGVSIAVAKAAAMETGLPLYRYLGGVSASTLPIPMMNIINGGSHADNKIDIQEFMIMPVGAQTFSDALRMGTEIFHHLKQVLKKKGMSTNVGDEGGFAPSLKSNEDAIKVILTAIKNAGYKAGKDVYLALDAAASEFYNKKKKKYVLSSSGDEMTASELVDMYAGWCKKYPIISIEDGLEEDDWDGWKLMTDKLGEKVQIVGDDLFVTNSNRLVQGINKGIANSILIKLNQIGTVTETIDAVELARENSYTSIISHRSGETEDTTIADLAVALNTGLIKTGSASRTDRVAKYNQLLRIEEELGKMAYYLGSQFKYAQ